MRRTFILIAVILSLAGLASCDKPLTVEQRIIATIRNMEAQIEEGERAAFMKHIAPDFTAQNDAMNRDQVRAFVIFQMNRHKNLSAQLFPIRVTGAGDSATAHFKALVTGGPGLLPESGQVFEFETHWRLVDDEWLLQTANWSPNIFDDVY